MRSGWSAALTAVFWWVIGFSLANAAPSQGEDAALTSSINGRMAALIRLHKAAGAAVAVVRNGHVILLKGYGLEQISPARGVDPGASLFGIASTTKIFTWIALMQAANAGRVDLSRPVNAYLPDDLKVPERAGWRQITGLDLMRHTEGFEDGDLRIDYRCGRVGDPLRDYLRRYRVKRERPPGDTPSYSNYGVNIAAFMATQASGLADVPTLFEQHIFKPLGMTSTTLRNRCPAVPGAPAPMAPALSDRRTPFVYWDGTSFRQAPDEAMPDAPASDVSTTAADMAKFMLVFLEGDARPGAPVLSPSTIAAFQTPLLGGGQTNGWAHGLMMSALPDGEIGYGHDGGTWSTSSTLVMEPSRHLGIFAVANTQAAGPELYSLAADALRDSSALVAFGPHRLRPPDPGLKRRAGDFSGDYLTTRRAFGGLAGLVGWSPTRVSITADGYLTTSAEGLERRWAPTSQPGVFIDAAGDDRLSFKLDRGGRAVSWRPPTATRTYERLAPWDSQAVFVGCLGAGLIASIAITVTALSRLFRRRAAAARPQVLRLFDRGQTAAAVLVLVWLGLAAATAVTTNSAGPHERFPPATLLIAALAALSAVLFSAALLVGLPAAFRQRRSLGGFVFRGLCLVATLAFLARIATLGALSLWA